MNPRVLPRHPQRAVLQRFGLWAALLRLRGLDVTAVDNFSSHGTSRMEGPAAELAFVQDKLSGMRKYPFGSEAASILY